MSTIFIWDLFKAKNYYFMTGKITYWVIVFYLIKIGKQNKTSAYYELQKIVLGNIIKR